MAKGVRRQLNPRTMLRPTETSRPGGTNHPMSRPGGTNHPMSRPGGTNHPMSRPGGTNHPMRRPDGTGADSAGDSGADSDAGTKQSVYFTERLKAGYSTARNTAWNEYAAKRRDRHTGNQWTDVGPNNTGGRVTCLAAGRSADELIAGAACGGIWLGKITKTKEGALQCKWEQNRKPVVDEMHNIGALAVDPGRSRVVYCGTGHAYDAGDSFPGVGLFRSIDYGEDWQIFTRAGTSIPHRISTIAVHRSHIRIGGVQVDLGPDGPGEPSGDERPGMFYAKRIGREIQWKRDNFHLDRNFARKIGLSKNQTKGGLLRNRDYQCHSIVYSHDAILTAISGVLDWSGIWRSKDDGDTWEQLIHRLPCAREFGRTSLAVAKEESDVVYAFVGAADGRCLGVFRTADGGDHWVSHGVEHFAACGGLNYTNCIVVSPHNPDLVVCGSRDLHRSTDGGRTWTQVTEWFAAPDSRIYSHADHHALLWPAPHRLYSANDGGVDVSDDNGITWTNLSSGLAITMFYDIDVAPSFVSSNSEHLIMAGGTQDNATVMTAFETIGLGYVPTDPGVQLAFVPAPMQGNKGNMITITSSGGVNAEPGAALSSLDKTAQHVQLDPTTNFANILYGDGGWIVFDPGEAAHVYGSSQYMEIYRHRRDEGWVTVTPQDATDEERGQIWMAIIAMHPRDPNIVFTGSTRVWRTSNDGDDWTPVSPELDGSPITAIEIADADPKWIYVGTEQGNIFKSTDGGNRWNDDMGEDQPMPLDWRKAIGEQSALGIARAITRIETDPDDANKGIMTLLGFDWQHKDKRFPHVIRFDGNDFVNADRRNRLPNVHHNVVTWSTEHNKQGHYDVLVGNDVGVWISHDLSKHEWHDVSGNLPNAIVTDLVYHKASLSLTAATYGRSLWHIKSKVLDKFVKKAQMPPASKRSPKKAG